MKLAGYRSNKLYSFFYQSKEAMWKFLCDCANDEKGVKTENESYYVLKKIIKFAISRNKGWCNEFSNKSNVSENGKIVQKLLTLLLERTT